MTDCERLLHVLKDGKPHGHAELYRLGMIVHSRVADLRKQGYRIDCRSVGRVNGRALYEYQLASSAESPQSNAFGETDRAHGEDVGRGGSAEDGQLVLTLPGLVPRERFA